MPSNIFSSFKGLFKCLLTFSHINSLPKQPDLPQRPSKDSPKRAKARFSVKRPWKRRSTASPVHHFSSQYSHRNDIHNDTCASFRLEIRGSAAGLSPHHSLCEQQQHPFTNLVSDAETTDLETPQSSQFELESDSSSEHLGLRVQRSFYRLHYGPQIDNIEYGPHLDSTSPLLSFRDIPEEVESFRLQELDHEVAETLSLGIHKQQRRSIALSNTSYDNDTTSSPSSPRLPLNRCKTSRGICRPSGSCISSPPETPTTPRSFMSLALRSQTFSRKVAPAPRTGGHRDKGNPRSSSDVPGMPGLHQERTKAVARLRQRQQEIVAQKGEGHSRVRSGPSGKLLNTITCARIDRGAGDRERNDIRSPNECALTPQTTTFCDWSLGLRHSSEQSPSTHDRNMFSRSGDTIWEKEDRESRDGSVFRPPLSVSSRRHPILAQTERAERLLVHIKEKVDDQLRLENALWDTDALLMRYEAAVARDWEAKFVDLCQNVRELQLLVLQEPKSHD